MTLSVPMQCLSQWMIIAVVAMGSLMYPGAGPASAQTSLFGTNLIVNGNAEQGTGSSDGSVVPVPGWTVPGNLTAVQYQPDGSSTMFPTTSSPGPSDRGANFFAGGPNNHSSEARQFIDLAPVATTIDRGGVAVRFQGSFGGWGRASAHLWALYQDANGQDFGSLVIGGNNPGHGQLGFDINEYWQDTVPIGTRRIELWLTMSDSSNTSTETYNNAYADSLSLVLTPPPTADLSIALSDAPDPVHPKQSFTHTISVHNFGPDASLSAFVGVKYPKGTDLVGFTAAPAGETTSPDGETEYFYSLGSLPAGQTASFDLVFRARRARAGTYTTTATVDDQYDHDHSNNTGSTTTTTSRKAV